MVGRKRCSSNTYPVILHVLLSAVFLVLSFELSSVGAGVIINLLVTLCMPFFMIAIL